jgi:rubredoxin
MIKKITSWEKIDSCKKCFHYLTTEEIKVMKEHNVTKDNWLCRLCNANPERKQL